MNNLLLFFALPVATIILAVVLQRIIKSPVLVALTAFAIYLIVAFSAFDETFLVFAIVYTILAFLAAAITKIIVRMIRCQGNSNGNGTDNNDDTGGDSNEEDDEECGCRENLNSCICNNRSADFYRTYKRRY